jgi:hypothetical protein
MMPSEASNNKKMCDNNCFELLLPKIISVVSVRYKNSVFVDQLNYMT